MLDKLYRELERAATPTATLAITGMRPGGSLALRWCDIDL